MTTFDLCTLDTSDIRYNSLGLEYTLYIKHIEIAIGLEKSIFRYLFQYYYMHLNI